MPGTSANLGPGFDLMGLALKTYNSFFFEFSSDANFQSILKNGKATPFSRKDDLVYFSYNKYFEIFLPDKNRIPYNIVMDLSLPLKGGLGSSASACVAGFIAANTIHKKFYKEITPPKENEILFQLAKLEGHPDNTTPAYLGGFVFAYFTENEKLHYFKKKIPSNIDLFVFIPCYETDTNHSRKKLPLHYSTKDVIFNMARVGTWMEYIHNSKFEDLLLALDDQVHTPYRIQNEALLQEIQIYSKKNQIGFALSGSGPTILFFMEKIRKKHLVKNLEKEICSITKKTNTRFRFFQIEPDYKGSTIKIL
ncbi:MAG: homoserine kinase [Leptospiraceae bacterium]|nr:homoserine kinase [Leptospiraceae bacterium]